MSELAVFIPLLVWAGMLISIIGAVRKAKENAAAKKKGAPPAAAKHSPAARPGAKAAFSSSVPEGDDSPNHVHTKKEEPYRFGPAGSIRFESQEGEEPPDHVHSLGLDRREGTPGGGESAVHVSFTPSALVNAFVMQEILTRPDERIPRI